MKLQMDSPVAYFPVVDSTSPMLRTLVIVSDESAPCTGIKMIDLYHVLC